MLSASGERHRNLDSPPPQRQQQRPTIRNTSNSSTTGTTGTSRICMVQCNRRQPIDCHQYDSFRRLCDRVLGRRKQPSAIEPLRQRGPIFQQPPTGMAQQINEAHQLHTFSTSLF
jgi:hypothetical protein